MILISILTSNNIELLKKSIESAINQCVRWYYKYNCEHIDIARSLLGVDCESCDGKGISQDDECDECGSKLKQEFIVELKNALRDGAIIRGMDLKEEEVKFGEAIGASLINDILSSGDDVLIKLLNKLPKESFARLAKMTSQSNPCSK